MAQALATKTPKSNPTWWRKRSTLPPHTGDDCLNRRTPWALWREPRIRPCPLKAKLRRDTTAQGHPTSDSHSISAPSTSIKEKKEGGMDARFKLDALSTSSASKSVLGCLPITLVSQSMAKLHQASTSQGHPTRDALTISATSTSSASTRYLWVRANHNKIMRLCPSNAKLHRAAA